MWKSTWRHHCTELFDVLRVQFCWQPMRVTWYSGTHALQLGLADVFSSLSTSFVYFATFLLKGSSVLWGSLQYTCVNSSWGPILLKLKYVACHSVWEPSAWDDSFDVLIRPTMTWKTWTTLLIGSQFVRWDMYLGCDNLTKCTTTIRSSGPMGCITRVACSRGVYDAAQFCVISYPEKKKGSLWAEYQHEPLAAQAAWLIAECFSNSRSPKLWGSCALGSGLESFFHFTLNVEQKVLRSRAVQCSLGSFDVVFFLVQLLKIRALKHHGFAQVCCCWLWITWHASKGSAVYFSGVQCLQVL